MEDTSLGMSFVNVTGFSATSTPSPSTVTPNNGSATLNVSHVEVDTGKNKEEFEVISPEPKITVAASEIIRPLSSKLQFFYPNFPLSNLLYEFCTQHHNLLVLIPLTVLLDLIFYLLQLAYLLIWNLFIIIQHIWTGGKG